MARYLKDLADVLRAAGLTVVEIPGWKTRGRPGRFNPTGILAHHTGGASDSLAYVKWMALEGRADEDPPLPAPLAQLSLDREGVWYVMAAGRANHAGRCKPVGGLKTYGGGRGYGDGNEQMVGVEAMNTGDEGWAPAQYDSYVRGVSALTRHYGWRPPLGHKETSLSGKPDPGRMDMDKFRRDVAADNPNQEDDMPTTKEVVDGLLAADRIPAPSPNPGNPNFTVAGALEWTLRRSSQTYAAVTELKATVAGLSAAVEALAASKGADPAVIAEEVAKAVKERLAQITVSDAADPS